MEQNKTKTAFDGLLTEKFESFKSMNKRQMMYYIFRVMFNALFGVRGLHR